MSQTINHDLPKKTKQGGIGLDILWVLVILSGFLFFTSLIPLPPNDFWWHLKIGEYIFTNHSIPTTNIYAWSLPADQPFFYAAWLAELLFYILYRLGNLDLIIFTRTILIAITMCLVAIEVSPPEWFLAYRRLGDRFAQLDDHQQFNCTNADVGMAAIYNYLYRPQKIFRRKIKLAMAPSLPGKHDFMGECSR